MENKKGVAFKVFLALSFIAGAMAYFYACMYSAYTVGKFGFVLLTVLSLLCAVGSMFADAEYLHDMRSSSKFFIILFVFMTGAGSLATEIFLLRQMELAAIISAAAACILSALSAVILAGRFHEDDL